MLSLLFIGFLIGMRHALEADHVAALATLATDAPSLKSAVRQGAAWGAGHTITLLVFGSLVILTDSVIPENLASGLEFAVGIMLVILGIDVIRRMLRDKVHFHSHQHDNNKQHFHAHRHNNESSHNPKKHQHNHHENFPRKALFIGLMHGMAGSAALILLTLQSVTSPLTGILYILLFGTGSIIGMAALSVIIVIPLKHSASGLTWVNNGFQCAIGIATIFLGSSLIYDIGINYI